MHPVPLLLSLVMILTCSPLLRATPLPPMLGAHDCGTGYLDAKGNLINKVVYDWTKTQSGNITSQLNCGARLFDWRPALDSKTGNLVFHHGSVTVDHSMKDAAQEVVDWVRSRSKSNGVTIDDLVWIQHWDCVGGSACDSKARQAYNETGLPILPCSAKKWSYEQVLNYTNNFNAFVLIGCPLSGNYDDRLGCNGFVNVSVGQQMEANITKCLKSFELVTCISVVADIFATSEHYSCYPGGKNHDIPWDRFYQHDKAYPGIGNLMGNWAEHVNSVVFGFLSGSSLLEDEARSGFNANLPTWIQDFKPKYINVNSVCNGGLKIADSLRKVNRTA